MQRIKFMLEYHCIPIWLYDSNDNLIGPEIPKKLSNDHKFIELINEITKEFDELYENNKINFEYKGFASEAEKKMFFTKVSKAIKMLRNRLDDNYIIQVDVNDENY